MSLADNHLRLWLTERAQAQLPKLLNAVEIALDAANDQEERLVLGRADAEDRLRPDDRNEADSGARGLESPDDAESDPIDVLKEDLFNIYYRAGQEVEYTTDTGKVRPYWANRYLQSLKKAVEEGDAEVVSLVSRFATSEQPSRGYGYLAAADRPDLTVEALVADASKPYHHLFEPAAVRAARARLRESGFGLARRVHRNIRNSRRSDSPNGQRCVRPVRDRNFERR